MTASDYTHPRLDAPDELASASCWDDLAKAAAATLARRQPDDADHAAWAAIAADWHWIATGEGTPADRSTLPARIAALDAAIARFFDQLDSARRQRRDPKWISPATHHQIKCLSAMRWHAEREQLQCSVHPEPVEGRHARQNAALGHHWRKTHGHPTLAQMRAGVADQQRKVA